MIALVTLVAYLSQLNNDKQRAISVLDESGYLNDLFEDTENTDYTILKGLSLEDAKAQVKAKEDYGLLHILPSKALEAVSGNVKFYSEESPSIPVINGIERKIEKRLSEIKLARNGVTLAQIEASKIDVNVAQESFAGEKSSKVDGYIKLAFGGAAGYLLFMFIIIYVFQISGV